MDKKKIDQLKAINMFEQVENSLSKIVVGWQPLPIKVKLDTVRRLVDIIREG